MKRTILCAAIIWSLSVVATPAFENADFEKGDLSGWIGDGNWCVVTPEVAFGSARVSVHGMFSAVAMSERAQLFFNGHNHATLSGAI